MKNEQTQTQEKETKYSLTFKLWNFENYKNSVREKNKYKQLDYLEQKDRLKRQLQKIKQELRDLKKPIKTKITQEGFKEEIKRQKDFALSRGFKII